MASSAGESLPEVQPPDNFQERFSALMAQTKVEFRKYEGRQAYDESGDSSWEAWLQRDINKSLELLSEFIPEQEALLEPPLQRNVRLRRLRIVTLPISDYTLWEFASYRLSAQIGEEIRCIVSTDQSPQLPDFVSFDHDALIELHYGRTGELTGFTEWSGQHQRSKDLLLRYEQLWVVAVPFDQVISFPRPDSR